MLDEKFLTELLGKEDVSAADKIKQIIAEHEADERGLLQKRDELLGSEKKLKEQIAAYEAGKGEYEKKVAGLEEELKKASSEDHKKYYETQLADLKAKQEAELKKVSADRDYYKTEHLKNLRNAAIEKGTESLRFVPGLKHGFIARVLEMNDFQPQDIDGSMKFLNKDHHTIEEAINAFALTPEGKAYIANPSTGGGARGSGFTSGDGGGKTITRSQYESMVRENPQGARDFFATGGRIAD